MSKLSNFVDAVEFELGVGSATIKRRIGDSVDRSHVSVNQVLRYLYTIGNTVLADQLEAVYNTVRTELRDYRFGTYRTDAVDVNEFLDFVEEYDSRLLGRIITKAA